MKSETLWLDEDEFGQSSLMVPFPQIQVVCEVEVEGCFTADSLPALIQRLNIFPVVIGNLVRRDNQRDFATSELRLTQVEMQD